MKNEIVIAANTGPCAVLCCGCKCLLAKDGSLIQAMQGGVLTMPDNPQLIRMFQSKEDADTQLATEGWAVVDDEGPNHRCPACVKKEASILGRVAGAFTTARRGAYIQFKEIE